MTTKLTEKAVQDWARGIKRGDIFICNENGAVPNRKGMKIEVAKPALKSVATRVLVDPSKHYEPGAISYFNIPRANAVVTLEPDRIRYKAPGVNEADHEIEWERIAKGR